MIILKKVIPFKKELPLDNKIYELSSISLEHEILQRTSDLISGEFLVSGSYKISPTSIEKKILNLLCHLILLLTLDMM